MVNCCADFEALKKFDIIRHLLSFKFFVLSHFANFGHYSMLNAVIQFVLIVLEYYVPSIQMFCVLSY